MTSPKEHADQETRSSTDTGLPPGRLEELRPRLEALLVDFAHLEEFDSLSREPMPAFAVEPARGDRDE